MKQIQIPKPFYWLWANIVIMMSVLLAILNLAYAFNPDWQSSMILNVVFIFLWIIAIINWAGIIAFEPCVIDPSNEKK